MPKGADSKIQDLSACVSHVKNDIIYMADEYHFHLDSITKGFFHGLYMCGSLEHILLGVWAP